GVFAAESGTRRERRSPGLEPCVVGPSPLVRGPGGGAWTGRSRPASCIGTPAACLRPIPGEDKRRAVMVDESCVFCRIIGGEETVSIVHEDDRTIAFMDIQPASPGHTLVVSRDHYPTLFETPDDLAAHCLQVAKRIAPGIRRATGADAVNVFSANGRAGGQDVAHFHIHLIPVRDGEEFALQLPPADAPIPSRSDLDVMAARISRAIQDGSSTNGR